MIVLTIAIYIVDYEDTETVAHLLIYYLFIDRLKKLLFMKYLRFTSTNKSRIQTYISNMISV